MNQELSQQNKAKEDVIKNLLAEIDSMKGERKKTEKELKVEMQKSLNDSARRMDQEACKSNVQIAGLKH